MGSQGHDLQLALFLKWSPVLTVPFLPANYAPWWGCVVCTTPREVSLRFSSKRQFRNVQQLLQQAHEIPRVCL